MAKVVDLRHKWAKEIGRVFIAFGSVESVTLECLKVIPRDNIFGSTKSFRLGQRIDLVKDLLEPHHSDDVAAFVSLLDQAKELAKERNLLAHNPLVLDIYIDEESDVCMEENIVSLQRKDKKMCFEDLQDLAEKSEVLVSQLYDEMRIVFREIEVERNGCKKYS